MPRRKKGSSVTRSRSHDRSRDREQSINHTSYNTVCLCSDCGNNWILSQSFSGLSKWEAKKNMKNLRGSVR